MPGLEPFAQLDDDLRFFRTQAFDVSIKPEEVIAELRRLAHLELNPRRRSALVIAGRLVLYGMAALDAKQKEQH